ncbi:amino acid permease [Clostridium tarantellae]|uniref:Amino acid permease n=1 Tax=Clostridium tarantellae TaxID=39493 RepID=A0A6I1MXD0_9CLOT|nr:amino acid permease [Clostridium tarantellae]MPQ44809.1 amino acid permease [Clostridium tarantellae]
MNIFRAQNLNSLLERTKESKKRILGVWDLILMSIGAVIGTGVMVLTGVVAAKDAGPSVCISFIGAGITCMLVVLCYAELASSVPSAGGSYSFAYISLGEIFGYIVGLCVVIGYILCIATVASGWSAYFTELLNLMGLHIPDLFTKLPSEGGITDVPAILSVLAVTFVLSRGTSESKKVNDIMVIVKLLVILVFIIVGAFFINTENWHPFMPYGVNGVWVGTASVFFAYTGFDATASAAEEVKNPEKALPIGLIVSLAVCTIIYVIVSLVLTGMVHYLNLNVGDALSYALNTVHMTWAGSVVSVGAIVGILAVMFANQYAGSRVLNTMSRDKLIPKIFSKKNKKSVPMFSLSGIAIIAVLLAGFIDLSSLANIANACFLIIYLLVSLSVIGLRLRYPINKGKFKTPFFPLIPILASASCIFLMVYISGIIWMYFSIILILIVVSYFLYGYKNSLLTEEVKELNENLN